MILVGKKMPENRRDDMCTKNELNSILQKLTQIYRSVYGENLVQVILYRALMQEEIIIRIQM